MSSKTTVTGDYRDDVQPSSSESGTGFRIGDNYILTAGHVVFEWNRRRSTNLNTNDILDGSNTVPAGFDIRGYQAAYLAAVQLLPTSGTRIANTKIEQGLAAKDLIIIRGGGNAGNNDQGLVTFLDPKDMKSLSALGAGVSIARHGNVTGTVSGSIATVDRRGVGTMAFTGVSDQGDSGAAYLLTFGGKEYVLGSQSSQEGYLDSSGNLVPTGNAVGEYFNYAEWFHINELMEAGQTLNVTGNDPTNLVIGSTNDDTAIGSYRADIMLGRNGKDTLDDGDRPGDSVWANDQLYGGADDDILTAGRGDDLIHGGDYRNYSGSGRVSIENDGIDTADYTTITSADPDKGVRISLLSQSDPARIQTFKLALNSSKTTTDPTGDFNHAIFVKDLGRDQANDTLVSIEKITATSAVDTLEIKAFEAAVLAGSDGKGGLSEIDFGANDKPDQQGDLIDASGSADRLVIDLNTTNGYVQKYGDANTKIKISNAERAWGGSSDDTITGNEKDNEIVGGGGNDTIYSSGGHDIISGGAGNDVLHLNDVSASIKFGAGDGNDLVETSGGDYQLALDALNPGDITLIAGGTDIYQTRYSTDLNTLTVKIKSTGDQITFIKSSNHANLFNGIFARDGVSLFEYQLVAATVENSPLNSIKFSDGTVWTAAEIWSKIANYQNNPDVAFDILQPLNSGYYGLIPADRQLGFSRLMANSASGAGSSSTTQGTLSTISRDPIRYIDHLNATYFQQDPLPNGFGQTIAGSPYGDGFTDGYGNDNLAGGLGNDGYSLSFGDDTITWNEGDGDDIAYGIGAYFGNDTLSLGVGIDPSDLQFAVTPDGAGLVISFSNVSGSITLADDLAAFADRGAFGISFHDGTTWTHQDLLSAASSAISAAHQNILGSSDADYLPLPQTNFTVRGNGGDDFLSVYGDGSGTISFAKGDGHDELSSYGNEAFRNDTLSLMDILPNEVELVRDGETLAVTVTATGDTFRINNQFTGTYPDFTLGVNRIVFADGTIWTRNEISTTGSDVIIGSDGSDILHGQGGSDNVSGLGGADILFGDDGDDTLIGGTGNDTLVGGGGGDTYVFMPGDGADRITETRATGTANVIQFGPGITASDVYIYPSSSGSDIIFGRIDSADTVNVDAMNSDSTKGIDEVHFADGAVWTYADIMARRASFTAGNDTITGSSGNDVLYGAAGNDTFSSMAGNDVLVGGTGNDTLSGGSGDDVYRFALGDGQDRISDYTFGSTGSGGNDTIRFGAGILPSALTVVQGNSGKDLVLTFAGNGDKITISSAITDAQFRTEQVTFVDGTIWSYADLLTKATMPTSGSDIFYGDETNQTLQGGGGNDRLYGRMGDDILVGGTGNDYLNGSAGGDTYVFALGDGSDVVDDNRQPSQVNLINSILLGAGITPEDTFIDTSANGFDIVVGFVGTSHTITISYMNLGSNVTNGIDQIQFADGSFWNYDDIMARRGAPSSGGNAISRTSSDQAFFGGADTSPIVAGNGLLVVDGDVGRSVLGAIELDGVDNQSSLRSDLETLSAFDSNQDGMLDAADDQYSNFSVWGDQNNDGIADATEFETLSQAGIVSIDLNGTPIDRDWASENDLVMDPSQSPWSYSTSETIAHKVLDYDASYLRNDALTIDGFTSALNNDDSPWQQFDLSRRTVLTASLVDAGTGRNIPVWSNRAAAQLVEQIAAFAPSGAETIEQTFVGRQQSEFEVSMLRPTTERSQFAAM